jgi:hypothetical protein
MSGLNLLLQRSLFNKCSSFPCLLYIHNEIHVDAAVPPWTRSITCSASLFWAVLSSGFLWNKISSYKNRITKSTNSYRKYLIIQHSRSQDSSVNIVTGCMHGWGIGIPFPTEARNFSPLQLGRGGGGGRQPDCCLTGTEDSFPRNKVAGGVKLTPHIQHVLRLRMARSILPPSHMSSCSGA